MYRMSVALLLLAAPLAAQQPAPRQPSPAARAVPDTSIFASMNLGPINGYRSANGEPGPRYWQQRADYTIKATLDTAKKELRGSETIHYTNNSPDTLRFIWMQMDQNLFRQGSTGSLLFPAGSRFGGRDFNGGFTISRIVQETPPAKGARRASSAGSPLKTRDNGTMMYVALAKPLPPHQATDIAIDYSFPIPEHGADRMGRDGSLYELAQWYPRMAVYDDVHGWNTAPYLGQGEFYLEYGDFDYQVTVPAGYIVAGTGELQNAAEVLTATQRARLARAAKSDTTIHIITQQEIESGAARPKKTGTQTWHFTAKNVRDVAWAGAPDYIWDASSWDGIMAYGYYRPSATQLWSEASKMARFSIKEYSERWFHYPYPQISAVEGPISGMEYPMLAMESRNQTPAGLYNVVTHEIGHMWYPMTVGSNERLYAWMDEGFNTFINTFSEEDYWKRDDTPVRRRESQFVTYLDRLPTAQPIMTPANRYLNNNNLGSLAYVKPSIVLLALRNKVLGPDVFDAGMREYTRRWAFKHPLPEDFFHTMEEVAGEDLSWFWREFFYTNATLDQSVESVKQEGTDTAAADSSGAAPAEVVIGNNSSAVMPVELKLTFADSTTKLVKLPVEIWYGGNSYTAQIDTDKQIIAAQVNPDGAFPDIDPRNDGWRASQPAASSGGGR
ncbi:MAG TPA: M1 family metallopeptidase [Gemmatimonadales bacterium]|nr:M1 family metallopeptidase [Gemmatimonadales bacterium]